MSAVSKRLTPASRQMSTRRVASATSLAPQALKNSLPPPNVPAPKLRTGTCRPERPSCLNSMVAGWMFCEMRWIHASGAGLKGAEDDESHVVALGRAGRVGVGGLDNFGDGIFCGEAVAIGDGVEEAFFAPF